MLTVTISLCHHCFSTRPIYVGGVDGLTPGKYQANLVITHAVCPTCEPKWLAALEKKPSVSQPDTGGLSSGEGSKQ